MEIFWVTFILLIWFQTHGVEEYAAILKLDKLLKLDEFGLVKSPELGYLEFLQMYYDSFFVRLITCPICLSVWLSLIACIISGSLFFFPAVNLIGLFLYLAIVKIL